MKEWFKYEFGYVNIDSENLYLTNSGNWSETKDLTEKTKSVARKNDSRSSSVLGFIILIVGLLGFAIIKSIIDGKLGITLILFAIGGGYKFYEYMKSEIGAQFKIPFNKISEIKFNENNIELFFINGEGNTDSYKLYKTEDKAINIINILNAHLVSLRLNI
ncbi:MAG: hypothetical protein V4548_03195 [Bacteroidota bacterium]